ncbi:hypothetical protein JCM21900_001072 [Sporobolomyces salmonicolor]
MTTEAGAHSTKLVSCDLLRPSCSACLLYAKARPQHRCVYGPNAANPGEPKHRSFSEGEADRSALVLPTRLRSETGQKKSICEGGPDASGLETPEVGQREEGDHVVELPLLTLTLPPSLVSPSSIAAPVPSPASPISYFVSVFAPSSPDTPVPTPAPILSPHPTSGVRHPSLPENECLLPVTSRPHRVVIPSPMLDPEPSNSPILPYLSLPSPECSSPILAMKAPWDTDVSLENEDEGMFSYV